MTTYIVKPDPTEDFYVEWSTIADDYISFGSAAGYSAERIARADEFGTSCHDLGGGLRSYSWARDALIVAQLGTIQRSDLKEYVQLRDACMDWSHLLHPLEEEL